MIWIFLVFVIFAPLWNIIIRYYTPTNKSSKTRPKRTKTLWRGKVCQRAFVLEVSVATQVSLRIIVFCHICNRKSNHLSLPERIAKVIAVAPKAIATSGLPQMLSTMASADAMVAITAVQTMLRLFTSNLLSLVPASSPSQARGRVSDNGSTTSYCLACCSVADI